MLSLYLKYIYSAKKYMSFVSVKLLLLMGLILIYSSVGFYAVEYDEYAKKPITFLDSLWWSLVSMTTVGYGDLYPKTLAGRFLIGLPTMVVGISILGYILSEVAAKLLESKSRRARGMLTTKYNDHIVIINYNDLNRVQQIIDELQTDLKTKDLSIVLIDEDLPELPKELDDVDIFFIKGNPSHKDVLQRANIINSKHILILAYDPNSSSSDDKNLGITLMIRTISSNLPIICECIDSQKINLLEAAGANSVICITEFTTNVMIQELMDPGTKEVIYDLTTNTFGQQIYVINLIHAKSIKELREYFSSNGYIFIGVKQGKSVHLNPDDDYEVFENDQIILIGSERPKDI
ncbi:MAG: hypothetical protein COA79_06120 [Planctomycetota bacterium]|nr:MAG: hypothetical protein COA79_06120 [Planctomycetota bacterium]